MMFVTLAAATAFLAGATMPPVYVGDWSMDPAACGGEDTHGVRITASSISFYEVSGTVRSVSQGSKGASARVDFSGEGEKWSESIRLHPLSDQRLELTALGGTHIYQRCSGASSK